MIARLPGVSIAVIRDGRIHWAGGVGMAETIAAIVQAGIPVMGHIGLTPQSVHTLGGYKVQGRGRSAAARLLADARAVERAGACAVVLELVPSTL